MKKLFLAIAILTLGVSIGGSVSAGLFDTAIQRSKMWCQDNWETSGYPNYDQCMYERKADGRSEVEEILTLPGDVARGTTEFALRQAYYNRPFEEENLTFQEWLAFHGYGYSGMGPVPQGSFTLPESESFGAEIGAHTDFRQYLLDVLNFLLSFLGIIAIAVVIFAGWMYVTSGGDDGQQEKAKKMILYACIGIIVILVSFALINTLITGIGKKKDVGPRKIEENVSVEVMVSGPGVVRPVRDGYLINLAEDVTLTFAVPSGSFDPSVAESLVWDFGTEGTEYGDVSVTRRFYNESSEYIRVAGRAFIELDKDENEIWQVFSGTTRLYNGSTVVADFSTSPARPELSETVIFDGSPSGAVLETISKYEWSCSASNGGICPAGFPSAQKKFAVTFDAAGSYDISLTVTSTDGGTATTEDLVVVGGPEEQIVTAEFSITPSRSDVDKTVVFDANASEVAFGEIASYSWTCSATLGGVCPSTWGASQKKFATEFDTAGSYNVTLTVTSDDGTTDMDEDVIVISNPAGGDGVLTPELGFSVAGQVAPGSHVTLDRGTDISVVSTGSVDEEGGSDFIESWSLNGKPSSPQEIAGTLKTELGTFNIVLKIKSNLTGDVASTTGDVVVTNQNPEIASLVPTLLSNPRSHVKVVASATDPDTTTPLKQYRFEVLRWGETVAVQPNPKPEAVFDLSKFKGNEEFVFRLTVVDIDGGTADYETTQSFDLPTPESLNTAPTTTILVQPGMSGDVRTNFYFSAVADDVDGDSLDYEWKFSDGMTRTGQMISRSFLFAGSYSVTLTVSDGLAEATASAGVTVSAPPPNQ